MTAACPFCKADVDVGVVHHGVGNDGRQRLTIEASHAPAQEGETVVAACADWLAKHVNLEELVSRDA